MIKFFCITLFFIIASCNNMEFVYDNNEKVINPLYEKTNVKASGVDVAFLNSYVPMFFGSNTDSLYELIIKIEEKKTKSSVKTNQATSNLRYELRFFYRLVLKEENCVVYEKEIVSFFSIIPKSGGYNYGTDASLDNKYELAISENFDQFISLLSDINMNNCR